jgi:FKBP-type peptidyl-prolyl cis-trans isomerase FklB
MTLSATRRARTPRTIQAAAFAVLFASVPPVYAQQDAAAPGTVHSKSADSYSLGVSVATQLHDAGVTSQNISGARLAAGVQDALTGKVKLTPEDRQNIDGLLGRAHEQAAPNTPPSATPHSSNADSYSLGVSMGSQLHASGVTPQDVSRERLAAGVQDALAGKVKTTPEDQQNVTGLLRRSHEQAGETNYRAAAAFLAENAKKKGIVTTASGLQYKVLAAGSGTPPKATDEVVVNYRGALLDGTEFDSSYKGGKPATFAVNHVIHGWTEALQLMKPGAKYQLFIPPKLAYDLQSPPGSGIPPGSLLLFDVELLSVKGQ